MKKENKKEQKDNVTQELINKTDIDFVNKMISKSEGLEDFKLSKSTLSNIAGWALNGSSDAEIRKKLDLNKNQWAILCSVCPTMIIIMEHSRAMADMIIAGSLFQTAVGGKRIRKQQPVRIREYDDKGLVCGEHYDVIEVEEELPPNPMLLKFLAENKLSEKFGERKGFDDNKIRDLVDNLSPEDRALLEAAARKSNLDGKN